MKSYQKIISIDSKVRSGKPCVRNLRITVADVLGYLAAGMSVKEVIADFPQLTKEDIQACLAYAAELANKSSYKLNDEPIALQVAEEKINYIAKDVSQVKQGSERKKILKMLQDYFKKEPRVSKAWIFGSFAREEDKPDSDIDIMVSYSKKASGTLLDYADVQHNLIQLLKRKIDLVEEGFVKPYAWNTIQKDLKLIYG